MLRPIILIPARMAATRLPGKPLLDIAGRPMIEHVWRRALEADLGPVAVASPDVEILTTIRDLGGLAIETSHHHASGSDRIFEALTTHDPEGAHDIVINLQGDVPTIEAASLRAVMAPLAEPIADLATLAVERPAEEISDPTSVKMAATPLPSGCLRALYFSRAPIPWGEGSFYHHVGIYAFRRAALQRFVKLPRSALEQREKLEQLRALEAGMRIDAALVDTCPIGVDTAETLQHVRDLLERKWTS